MRINPGSVAFDVDGVIADIMSLFIEIAKKEYNIHDIRYEDATCYTLEECLDVNPDVINEILNRILDGNYSPTLNPIEGAPEVLSRIGRIHGSILFVTARPYPGPIYSWLQDTLQLDRSIIDVVATGTFEGKADVLLSRNITYFVDDRLETCFLLDDAGITPVLFKQPWNRQKHNFIEISTWKELESLIEFKS